MTSGTKCSRKGKVQLGPGSAQMALVGDIEKAGFGTSSGKKISWEGVPEMAGGTIVESARTDTFGPWN